MKITRQFLIGLSLLLALAGWLLFFFNQGILWDLALYKDYSDHGRNDLFFKHYIDSGIIEQGYINHFIISNFFNPLLVYKTILVVALTVMSYCIIKMIRLCAPMDRETKWLTVFLLIAHPVMLVFISGVTIGYLLSLLFFVLGLYCFFVMRHWIKHVIGPLFFSLSILNFFITAGVYQVFVNYVLYRDYKKKGKLSIFNLFLLVIPIVVAGVRYLNFHQSGNYSNEYSDMNLYSFVISYLTILPQSFFPTLENSYFFNCLYFVIIGWMMWRLVIVRDWVRVIFMTVALGLFIVPFVISSSYMDNVIDWDMRYAVLMPLLGIFLVHFFLEQRFRKTALSLLAVSYSFFFAWFSVVQFSGYIKQKGFAYQVNKLSLDPGKTYFLQDSTNIGFTKTRFYEWTFLANQNRLGKRLVITEPSMSHKSNPQTTLNYFYGEAPEFQRNAVFASVFHNSLQATINYITSTNTDRFLATKFTLNVLK